MRSARPPHPSLRLAVICGGLAATLLLAQVPVSVQAPAEAHQGRQAIALADPSALRPLDASLDAAIRQGSLRRVSDRPHSRLAGRRSETLEQYHDGVPVHGAALRRQTDQGVTTSILGTHFADIDIGTTPTLSRDAARARAAALAGPLPLIADPELWILPIDGGYALTWKTSVAALGTLFTDAHSGAERWRVEGWREQSSIGLGTGVLGDSKKLVTQPLGGAFFTRDLVRPAELRTLDMRSDANRFVDRLLGVFFGDATTATQDLASDADNLWSDGAVVDTHAALGWTYDYLLTQIGWAGVDSRNGPVDAFVNPFDADLVTNDLVRCRLGVLDAETCSLVTFLANFIDNAAYFAPAIDNSTGVLVFGSPRDLPHPLTALDVVAHEMAHGVTHFAAALGDTPPPNEPGAINEGFSDIIGTAVEFYVQPPGTGTLQADYLMGEDLGSVTRSLRDPSEVPNTITGTYPDHYGNLYRGPLNAGGVHINAPILGHLFYLAVEGGTNRTSGRSVTGVGADNRRQIELVFFNAWANLLPPFADFPITADCLRISAAELYGPGSPPAMAIEEAIRAVGIPDFVTCHDLGGCR